MTLNMWHGGDGGKQRIEQTAQMILDAKADIVGLQEIAGLVPNGSPPGTPRRDNAAHLATLLGWSYHIQPGGHAGSNIGIICRDTLVDPVGEKKNGVTIRLPSNREVTVFNVHLNHAPYQPFQLLNIPYHNAPMLKTAAEAIAAAKQTRGAQVETLLSEIKQDTAAVTIVTGDFNEPSCLDWTKEAVAAKRHPLPVEWPTTKALLDAGFTDSYRQRYPDPVKHPGFTWTPITKPDNPKDHHDRIDFVFVRGAAEVQSVEIVGESAENADIVITPYPSDHRAVVTTLKLTKYREAMPSRH